MNRFLDGIDNIELILNYNEKQLRKHRYKYLPCWDETGGTMLFAICCTIYLLAKIAFDDNCDSNDIDHDNYAYDNIDIMTAKDVFEKVMNHLNSCQSNKMKMLSQYLVSYHFGWSSSNQLQLIPRPIILDRLTMLVGNREAVLNSLKKRDNYLDSMLVPIEVKDTSSGRKRFVHSLLTQQSRQWFYSTLHNAKCIVSQNLPNVEVLYGGAQIQSTNVVWRACARFPSNLFAYGINFYGNQIGYYGVIPLLLSHVYHSFDYNKSQSQYKWPSHDNCVIDQGNRKMTRFIRTSIMMFINNIYIDINSGMVIKNFGKGFHWYYLVNIRFIMQKQTYSMLVLFKIIKIVMSILSKRLIVYQDFGNICHVLL